MKSRIEEIIRIKGVSPARFADLLNVQRSSISHILSGRNKPSMDFIEKMLTVYPDINSNWLISGKGTMLGTHHVADSFSDADSAHQNEFVNKIGSPTATIDAPSLFDIPKIHAVNEIQPPSVVTTPNRVESITKNSGEKAIEHNKPRKITKIVLFYNDYTFEEFYQGL